MKEKKTFHFEPEIGRRIKEKWRIFGVERERKRERDVHALESSNKEIKLKYLSILEKVLEFRSRNILLKVLEKVIKIANLVDIVDGFQDTLAVVLGLVLITKLKSFINT